MILSSLALALEVPPLRGRVNDLAGIIQANRAQYLDYRLAKFESETGHQIAVLTIPSLEGDTLEDFSIRVAETWKIGQKDLDNGVILLWAQKERKIRIEVGYGLEGVLPDAVASRIIREVIAPRFRDADYTGGIEAGITSIMEVTRGEASTDRPRVSAKSKVGPLAALSLVAAALFAALIGIIQRTPVRAGLGGTIGAGLIGFPGALTSFPGVWLVVLLGGAIIGILSNTYAAGAWGKPWNIKRSRRERWPRDAIYYDGSGEGGSYFDGGGFGGGFGDGGFSGGGGDFGGGGASGDG